ncbi:Zinc finger MYM-type protein [Arachis hypogaea]|nr:Zinc finger MYM-type protein [Arachis hypogaea]
MNHEESEIQPPKVQRVASDEFDLNSLERDPGKRLQIWQYHPNQRDEVRRAYLKWGPYQKHLDNYPLSGTKHPRRFQYAWFGIFPSWLEYSPSEDAAYCLFCYLVSKKPSGRNGSDIFISKGFRNWKKVNDGKNCAFLKHIGDPCSPHNNAVGACLDLLNQASHIQNVIEDHTSEEIQKNRLRLKSSIDATRWLTFQACAFRGHDETPESKNRVDEARDESKREQMALVLRFVDIHGFIQERFLDLVHVKDTTSLTLKQELCGILSRHGLDVSNIRGQGYDGASNMRGEWNGLQALFLKDCPYAYYIHCFAHRLQLALVAASREVIPVHQFFSKLTFIVNIICSSSKRHDELHAAKTDEIVHLLEIDELETGKGANQIGTLKRAGDTRWSSHFSSVCSLINMYGATLTVLQKIIIDGSTYSQRGDADSAYNTLTSFEFVLILHLMKDMMGITDILCQALQKQSQDIVNAVQLVHSTKHLSKA